jgi:C-terminal processing protease CtpA/Prc
MVWAFDPHSYVLPVHRLAPEREKALRDGKLVPVPLSFRYVGGAAVVASVPQGSAAAALDILSGDELVAIDGQPLRARGAEELEIVLAGARNTAVSLTLERQRFDGSVAVPARGRSLRLRIRSRGAMRPRRVVSAGKLRGTRRSSPAGPDDIVTGSPPRRGRSGDHRTCLSRFATS